MFVTNVTDVTGHAQRFSKNVYTIFVTDVTDVTGHFQRFSKMNVSFLSQMSQVQQEDFRECSEFGVTI